MGSDVNTWSPTGGTAWVGLGGTGWLERSVLLGIALRFLCFLLALFLLPCLPPAATISYHDGLPPPGTLSFYVLPSSWGFTTATESN